MPEQELQKAPKTGKQVFKNGVAYCHSQLVSERFIDAIDQLLAFFNTSLVFSIVFKDNNSPIDAKSGRPTYASYCTPVNSIAFNLRKHFDAAMADIKKDKNALSIGGAIWLQMLLTSLHEIKHGMEIAMCDDETTFKPSEADCDLAQDWAYTAIMEAAASGRVDLSMVDLEMENDPFYGPLIQEELTKLIETKIDDLEPWQAYQLSLFEKFQVYSHEGFATESFMDYLCHLNAGQFDWIDIVLDAEPSESTEQVQTLAADLIEGAETLKVAPATPAPQALLASTVDGVEVRTVIENPGEEELVIDTSLFDDDMPVAEVPVETQVTPHSLTPEQAQQCLAQVMARLMAHVVNKCGITVAPGVPENEDVIGFSNPMAILDPCLIGDIEGAGQLIISYDTLDATGAQVLPQIPLFGEDAALRKTAPDGHIKGILNRAGTMPAFIFYVNVGGMVQKRSFRLQDCNKREGTSLKAWAKEARQGAGIALVFKELTDAQKAAGESSAIMSVKRMPGMTSTVTTFNPFDPQWAKEVPIG